MASRPAPLPYTLLKLEAPLVGTGLRVAEGLVGTNREVTGVLLIFEPVPIGAVGPTKEADGEEEVEEMIEVVELVA